MANRYPRRDVLKGAIGALALAACSPAAPAPSAGQAQPTAPAGPKRGGSLVLAGYNLTHMDPHQMTGSADLFMTGLCYNRLVRWKKDPAQGLGPEGELAESWDVSPDATGAVIRLRKGVKFQNVAPVNGRELKAADVKWSLERWSSDKPIFPRRAVWKPLKSVDVVDDYTVRINLSQPWPDLMVNLAQPFACILPREAVEAAGDDTKFTADPKLQIGTGPFILKDFQRDVGARWARNPEYFKQGQPYPDDLTIRWYNDGATRLAAIRSGEVADHGWGLTAVQYRTLQALPNIVTAQRPGTSWTGVMFNLKVKPFDDVRVRRAIAAALDPDAIVKGGYQGGAVVNRTALPVAFKDEALPESEWPKTDLVRAKQLLTEAGFPNGFTFTLMTLGNLEESKLAGEQIKEQLAKVGITVNVDLQDFAAFVRRATAKEYEANFIRTWAGDVVLSSYFSTFYTSTAPRNYMNYANPEFDRLDTELGKTLDPAKRKDLAYQMQRILIQDVPVAHVLAPIDYYGWQSWLKGYGTNWIPGSMAVYVDEFWIDK